MKFLRILLAFLNASKDCHAIPFKNTRTISSLGHSWMTSDGSSSTYPPLWRRKYWMQDGIGLWRADLDKKTCLQYTTCIMMQICLVNLSLLLV